MNYQLYRARITSEGNQLRAKAPPVEYPGGEDPEPGDDPADGEDAENGVAGRRELGIVAELGRLQEYVRKVVNNQHERTASENID